jgi:HD-GYP domain-containing protein (c-di-GMP phosphodiesterase class II)
VADIVLQHHERMDGSGYPDGLTGDSIGVLARILAVADVVEALSSHRPHRPAVGLDAAIEEVRRSNGKFDPAVVDACVRLYEQGRIEL